MSYHFLDDKDPRIDVMFQGLEKMEKMLSVIEKMPKSLFNGERFLTDEELSKVLRVCRSTGHSGWFLITWCRARLCIRNRIF